VGLQRKKKIGGGGGKEQHNITGEPRKHASNQLSVQTKGWFGEKKKKKTRKHQRIPYSGVDDMGATLSPVPLECQPRLKIDLRQGGKKGRHKKERETGTETGQNSRVITKPN